jgi:peroxiredoxin Q/BCP
MLGVKTLAPNFNLLDQNGEERSLLSCRGFYVLVYFYPKDDTPGCVTEACSIRDMYKDFEIEDVKVFGISADSTESHKKFAEKYKLPFTLLSDPKKEVIRAYEADNTPFIKRISYLIDPNGLVAKAYPEVDPAHHGTDILKDIYTLKMEKVH